LLKAIDGRSTVLDITILYDSVYLTCSKKLTGIQLSLPHGINKKIKCETKNNMVSVTVDNQLTSL